MRFQSFAPPPTFVGTRELVKMSIDHCLGSDLLGVDTETIGLLKDPETGHKYYNMTDQVVVMGLCPDDDTRYLVPRRYLHHYNDLLASEVPKALTNIKFDAHRLANSSGAVLGGHWVDTVVLDWLGDENRRHGLKPCMKDYFEIELQEYKDIFGSIDPRELVPGHPLWEKYVDYSSLDPWCSRKLAKRLLLKLSSELLWEDEEKTLRDLYWETEEPQLKTLFGMERRGFPINRSKLEYIEEALTAEMDALARELNQVAGRPLNPNSGQEVGKYLFEEKGIPHQGKTPTGKYKTTAAILEKLAYGKSQVVECDLILRYKKASKLRGTYAGGLQRWIYKDGRIHQSYNPTMVTGRLSCKEPNLQNIPRPDNDPHGIRSAFSAPPGYKLIVGDYAQLEMRILAVAAQDEVMIQAIKDGLDMHCFAGKDLAQMPYEEFFQAAKVDKEEWAVAMRTAAKSVGFGIVYGETEVGLAEDLSKKLKRHVSRDEAREYIKMYLTTFRGVGAYMRETQDFCKKHGYVLTIMGRRRRLPDAKSRKNFLRSRALRQAINAPIQGSAADIVKKAMLLCDADAYLTEVLEARLIHQVHDELIFLVPEENAEEALEIIREYMEHPFAEDLEVPLIAEPSIVDNWQEGK